jgi:Mg2+/citrate symporter
MDNIERRASYLINTSVEDVKSSIASYTIADLPVLVKALEICQGRNEKTRVKVLQSKVRQLTKLQERMEIKNESSSNQKRSYAKRKA